MSLKPKLNSKTKLLASLRARRVPLASPDVQRATLRQLPLAQEFDDALRSASLWPLSPQKLTVFQMNLGKMCNQTCRHCHVDAGPDRREVMTRETMMQCLRVIEELGVETVDLTGGAPEMNPNFRWLLGELHALGCHIIDRCNLTILDTTAHKDLPELFATYGVEVVCSLPHYRALNTDRQRGDGVYEKSIRVLQQLNQLGYGDGKSGLRLVLVTNPVGAFLPAQQASLEAEWKRELSRHHGVQFDALHTITNMPISRYLEWLVDTQNLQRYMEKLVRSFNPTAASNVMCRHTLSVGWDGQLYDCDFNQMLDMPIASHSSHVRDINAAAMQARAIAVDRHCFGCTAGAGSSCGGATASASASASA